MSDQNKAVLRRHFAEVWSEDNVALVDALFASDCLSHAPPDKIEGREGLQHYVSAVRTAFPDLRVTLEDQIAEGDRVVARWTARGTHTGAFQDLPPAGKQGSVTGISIFRIANGKVVECWTNWGALGVMQQLGVIPMPEQVGRPAGGQDEQQADLCLSRALAVSDCRSRIVLPGYTVLQELVGKALTEEQQRLMTLLQKQLAPHECATFDTLFADTDGLYTLTRLKHEPKDFSLGAMRQEIRRQCLQVVASERSPPPQLEHAKPPARFETIRATLLGVEIASNGR